MTSGEHDLLEMPESITGRRISYASSDVFFFQGTLGDNLFYGLKHAPLQAAQNMKAPRRSIARWEIDEARSAGNPDFDIRATGSTTRRPARPARTI